MTDFAEHLTLNRRLLILILLADANGAANDAVLHQGLQSLGHNKHSHEDTRQDINFLQANGLVTVNWVGKVMVASITERGFDTSKGRINVTGVQKPALGL